LPPPPPPLPRPLPLPDALPTSPSPHLFAAVGIHPHDASEADEQALAEITALARDAKVVAVGETGLDYHYNRSPPDAQKRALAARSEEHTSELQSRENLVCRRLL